MQDYTAFDAALNADETSYNVNLARSMSLVLDEFYETIRTVGVSSATGEGFDDFLAAVTLAETEYKE